MYLIKFAMVTTVKNNRSFDVKKKEQLKVYIAVWS